MTSKSVIRIIESNLEVYMNFFLLCGLIFALPISSYAAYTVKEGKLIATHELATLSASDHFGIAKDALEKGNWVELIRQARILDKNFPGTPFSQDAHFYAGLGYFHLQELDMANRYFSAYLKTQATPKFFEETIKYKFSIAQEFEKGAKRRLLGKEGMPKWMSGKKEAIEIYNEVVAALPQNDLAVQSLFGKANILFQEEDFQASIEVFQTLLRRFPKSPLARDSYVAIAEVYKTWSEKEYADPDFLDLAMINVKKFSLDFPEDPKLAKAQEIVQEMLEVYAKDLYETAKFYERTKKPKAAIIYYTKIVTKYPNTPTAALSQSRLNDLLPNQPSDDRKDPVIPTEGGTLVDNTSIESIQEIQ